MTGWYFFCQQIEKKRNGMFLIGTAILMTLFYGLRDFSVGSDTMSYITMFQEDGSQSVSQLWEYMWEKKSPAFVLAEWLFYQILPFPRLWLIATSAFFFFIISKFIEKNSVDSYFSYLMFFTIFGTFQMTGIRQSCAMAVLMLAFEQMKKKKFVQYLLLIALAYLFHKSAIIFLPFYFWGKRKITKVDIPILATILVVIYSNRSFLFDYIKGFTSYDYFEQLNHNEPINFSIMIYGTTVVAILLCIWLVSHKKKDVIKRYREEHQIENKLMYKYITKNIIPPSVPNEVIHQEVYQNAEVVMYSQYANAMILASLFMPLVAVNGAVRRIVMYFALFMILLIPKVFREFLDSKIRFILKLIFMVVLIYLLLSGVQDSSYSYSCSFLF